MPFPDLGVVRLHDGAYLLCGRVANRPLQLTLLIGEEKSLLLDTGCESHVQSLILPCLKEIGVHPTGLSFIVTSHSDLDHQGGNDGMKRFAPQALLCCGDADRSLIESPEMLLQNRYDAYRYDHDHFYPPEAQDWNKAQAGKERQVDITFGGGERIRLDAERELLILHLPGHSPGHLGVWDLKNRTLFGADAIHGSVYLDVKGNPALCPTYVDVASYLATTRLIESLPLDMYCGCHWPVKRGVEIQGFCQESRHFVEKAEALLIEALETPQTLGELCSQLGPRLGSWPAAINNELCYAFSGHISDLQTRGIIKRVSQERPARYARI